MNDEKSLKFTSSRFERPLEIAVAIRFLTLIPKAFLPFTLPETWRQSVTMGVTLRYWNRWMYGDGSIGSFLPAVLDSANGTGVMPMEAPLLNIAFAPFFAFGPYWGKSAAVLAITVLQFGLLFIAHRIWRDKLGPSLLLLPFVSFTFGWFGKFTPDLVSVLLVLIGVGLAFRREHARWLVLGSTCVLAGLLMKPTSIALLALALGPGMSLLGAVRNFAITLGVPTVLAASYYLGVNPWIETLRDSPPQFPVGMRNPYETLRAIFATPVPYFRVFGTRLFVPYGVFPVALIAGLAARSGVGTPAIRRLALIFCLQVLVLTLLSGTHVFDHEYYFMPLAPLAAYFFFQAFRWIMTRARSSRQAFYQGVFALLLVLTVVPTLEALWIDYRPWTRGIPEMGEAGECAELVSRHPEIPFRTDYPFRSAAGPFPTIGLCFGEREMATRSEWGFFRHGEAIPADCHAIDRSESFQLVRCEFGRGMM